MLDLGIRTGGPRVGASVFTKETLAELAAPINWNRVTHMAEQASQQLWGSTYNRPRGIRARPAGGKQPTRELGVVSRGDG